MPPEFYDGVMTFKLDVFSLGIIILEMLTGKKGYCKTEDVRKIFNISFQDKGNTLK